MNKLVALPVALLIAVASTVVFTSAPAQAIPGGCSVVISTKLTVDAPYKRFPARLAADCAASGEDWAAWDVNHTYYGPDDILFFDSGMTTEVWEFYDWNHLGSYRVYPSDAYDYDSNSLPQNSVALSVRLGSRLTLTTARKGKFVTLRSTATRYTPSADRFRPWAGKPVLLYRRANVNSAWQYFRQVRTNKNGQISTRFQQAAAKYYQARTADANDTWGRMTPAKRR